MISWHNGLRRKFEDSDGRIHRGCRKCIQRSMK